MGEDMNATEIAVALARENERLKIEIERRKLLAAAKEKGDEAAIRYLEHELNK